jgi:hypothetical protein
MGEAGCVRGLGREPGRPGGAAHDETEQAEEDRAADPSGKHRPERKDEEDQGTHSERERSKREEHRQ